MSCSVISEIFKQGNIGRMYGVYNDSFQDSWKCAVGRLLSYQIRIQALARVRQIAEQ